MSATDTGLGVRRDAVRSLLAACNNAMCLLRAIPEGFVPSAVLDCVAPLAKGVSLGGETRLASTADGANASPDLYVNRP
jgi:hypothetical protein